MDESEDPDHGLGPGVNTTLWFIMNREMENQRKDVRMRIGAMKD